MDRAGSSGIFVFRGIAADRNALRAKLASAAQISATAKKEFQTNYALRKPNYELRNTNYA